MLLLQLGVGLFSPFPDRLLALLWPTSGLLYNMRLRENRKPCLFAGLENVEVIGMAREHDGCWLVGLESDRV